MYEYNKQKLHKGVSHARKKSDIDNCLEELDIDPPMHRVWMSGGPLRETVLKIASASTRFHPGGGVWFGFRDNTQDLNISAVPREQAGAVRAKMKEQGLKLIITRIAKWLEKPQIWHFFDHYIELYYDTRTMHLRIMSSPWRKCRESAGLKRVSSSTGSSSPLSQ